MVLKRPEDFIERVHEDYPSNRWVFDDFPLASGGRAYRWYCIDRANKLSLYIHPSRGNQLSWSYKLALVEMTGVTDSDVTRVLTELGIPVPEEIQVVPQVKLSSEPQVGDTLDQHYETWGNVPVGLVYRTYDNHLRRVAHSGEKGVRIVGSSGQYVCVFNRGDYVGSTRVIVSLPEETVQVKLSSEELGAMLDSLDEIPEATASDVVTDHEGLFYKATLQKSFRIVTSEEGTKSIGSEIYFLMLEPGWRITAEHESSKLLLADSPTGDQCGVSHLDVLHMGVRPVNWSTGRVWLVPESDVLTSGVKLAGDEKITWGELNPGDVATSHDGLRYEITSWDEYDRLIAAGMYCTDTVDRTRDIPVLVSNSVATILATRIKSSTLYLDTYTVERASDTETIKLSSESVELVSLPIGAKFTLPRSILPDRQYQVESEPIDGKSEYLVPCRDLKTMNPAMFGISREVIPVDETIKLSAEYPPVGSRWYWNDDPRRVFTVMDPVSEGREYDWPTEEVYCKYDNGDGETESLSDFYSTATQVESVKLAGTETTISQLIEDGVLAPGVEFEYCLSSDTIWHCRVIESPDDSSGRLYFEYVGENERTVPGREHHWFHTDRRVIVTDQRPGSMDEIRVLPEVAIKLSSSYVDPSTIPDHTPEVGTVWEIVKPDHFSVALRQGDYFVVVSVTNERVYYKISSGIELSCSKWEWNSRLHRGVMRGSNQIVESGEIKLSSYVWSSLPLGTKYLDDWGNTWEITHRPEGAVKTYTLAECREVSSGIQPRSVGQKGYWYDTQAVPETFEVTLPEVVKLASDLQVGSRWIASGGSKFLRNVVIQVIDVNFVTGTIRYTYISEPGYLECPRGILGKHYNCGREIWEGYLDWGGLKRLDEPTIKLSADEESYSRSIVTVRGWLLRDGGVWYTAGTTDSRWTVLYKSNAESPEDIDEILDLALKSDYPRFFFRQDDPSGEEWSVSYYGPWVISSNILHITGEDLQSLGEEFGLDLGTDSIVSPRQIKLSGFQMLSDLPVGSRLEHISPVQRNWALFEIVDPETIPEDAQQYAKTLNTTIALRVIESDDSGRDGDYWWFEDTTVPSYEGESIEGRNEARGINSGTWTLVSCPDSSVKLAADGPQTLGDLNIGDSWTSGNGNLWEVTNKTDRYVTTQLVEAVPGSTIAEGEVRVRPVHEPFMRSWRVYLTQKIKLAEDTMTRTAVDVEICGGMDWGEYELDEAVSNWVIDGAAHYNADRVLGDYHIYSSKLTIDEIKVKKTFPNPNGVTDPERNTVYRLDITVRGLPEDFDLLHDALGWNWAEETIKLSAHHNFKIGDHVKFVPSISIQKLRKDCGWHPTDAQIAIGAEYLTVEDTDGGRIKLFWLGRRMGLTECWVNPEMVELRDVQVKLADSRYTLDELGWEVYGDIPDGTVYHNPYAGDWIVENSGNDVAVIERSRPRNRTIFGTRDEIRGRRGTWSPPEKTEIKLASRRLLVSDIIAEGLMPPGTRFILVGPRGRVERFVLSPDEWDSIYGSAVPSARLSNCLLMGYPDDPGNATHFSRAELVELVDSEEELELPSEDQYKIYIISSPVKLSSAEGLTLDEIHNLQVGDKLLNDDYTPENGMTVGYEILEVSDVGTRMGTLDTVGINVGHTIFRSFAELEMSRMGGFTLEKSQSETVKLANVQLRDCQVGDRVRISGRTEILEIESLWDPDGGEGKGYIRVRSVESGEISYYPRKWYVEVLGDDFSETVKLATPRGITREMGWKTYGDIPDGTIFHGGHDHDWVVHQKNGFTEFESPTHTATYPPTESLGSIWDDDVWTLPESHETVKLAIKYYNRKGEEISQDEAWDINNSDDRVVGKTELREGSKEVTVSTVLLLTPVTFGERPMIFETMVFEGKLDGERVNYATEGEAIEGHREMVERVIAETGAEEIDAEIKLSSDRSLPEVGSRWRILRDKLFSGRPGEIIEITGISSETRYIFYRSSRGERSCPFDKWRSRLADRGMEPEDGAEIKLASEIKSLSDFKPAWDFIRSYVSHPKNFKVYVGADKFPHANWESGGGIYVPEGLSEMEANYVLVHEYAHVDENIPVRVAEAFAASVGLPANFRRDIFTNQLDTTIKHLRDYPKAWEMLTKSIGIEPDDMYVFEVPGVAPVYKYDQILTNPRLSEIEQARTLHDLYIENHDYRLRPDKFDKWFIHLPGEDMSHGLTPEMVKKHNLKNDMFVSVKHHPEVVDEDIRDTCLMLSALPYARTVGCCSGHATSPLDTAGFLEKLQKPGVWGFGFDSAHIDLLVDYDQPGAAELVEKIRNIKLPEGCYIHEASGPFREPDIS